jgi:hypothetical protein
MGNKAQNNKTTPIIVLVSINEFADKLKDIRSICRKYKAIETLDNATNTILFYFHDNGLWLRAKQEIQLLVVGQINFKLSSKRVIIMEKMKDTIVEPPQPPT